jgi:phage-related protein
MDEKAFEVIYYDKPDGTFPAEEFILGQEPKMHAKLFKQVGLLEANGNRLREPHSKFLKDGVFELRAVLGSDITRVLYFFVQGREIILTHGFVKKTQKTPPAEIETAKKYRQEYTNRR